MQIRVLSSVLVGGVWHEPGIGNYSPELAQHLIDLGAAEPYETKVVTQIETKVETVDVKKSSAVSQAAPASQKKTLKRSKRPE